MAFSLYPSFVVITYSTAFGIHTMSLPTRAWDPVAGSFASGSFPAWDDDSPVEADTMIQELLTTLAEFVPTNTNFGRYTIYTMATPTSIPLPRYTAAIDIDGTAAPNSLYEASQLTFHFKTEDFNESKLVLLDAVQPDGFNKILNPLSFADVPAVATNWTSVDNAWAGRDGTRPGTIYSITCDLNDRLRRAYKDA